MMPSCEDKTFLGATKCIKQGKLARGWHKGIIQGQCTVHRYMNEPGCRCGVVILQGRKNGLALLLVIVLKTGPTANIGQG